jgi:MEMO1 family protein
MTDARPAELAGSWYPATAEACSRFLAEVTPFEGEIALKRIAGAIVPHAGWVYSGAVAEQTLVPLERVNPDANLVVVFGGHLGPRDRPRVFLDGAWGTPFGPLEVAGELAQEISMAIECELETPEEYYDDNAVEVLMPMVKKHWPKAQVCTVGVPPVAEAGKIGAEVITLATRRGFRPIVIGSTDLTHYGPNYDYRPQGSGHRAHEWVKTKNDPQIIAAIEELDAAKVLFVARQSRNACCPGAVAATIAACGKLGAKRAVTISYTTSYDARPRDEVPTSFVGYAGLLIGE